MQATLATCAPSSEAGSSSADPIATAMARSNMQALVTEVGGTGDVFAGARVVSRTRLPSGSTLAVPVDNLGDPAVMEATQTVLRGLSLGDGFGFYNLGVTAHMFKSAMHCLPRGAATVSEVLLGVQQAVGSSDFKPVSDSVDVWVVTETLPHDKCASSYAEVQRGLKQAFIVARASSEGSGDTMADAVRNSPGDVQVISEELTEKACASRSIVALAVKDAIVECFETNAAAAESEVERVLMASAAEAIKANEPRCVAFSTHTSAEYSHSQLTIRHDVTNNTKGTASAICNHGPSNGFTWVAPQEGSYTVGAYDWFRLDAVSNGFEDMSVSVLGLIATSSSASALEDTLARPDMPWASCGSNLRVHDVASGFHAAHGTYSEPITWTSADAGVLNLEACRLGMFPSVNALRGASHLKSGTFTVEAAALQTPMSTSSMMHEVACTVPGNTCMAPVSASSLTTIEDAMGSLPKDVLANVVHGSNADPTDRENPRFEVPAEVCRSLRKKYETEHSEAVLRTATAIYQRCKALHENQTTEGHARGGVASMKLSFVPRAPEGGE